MPQAVHRSFRLFFRLFCLGDKVRDRDACDQCPPLSTKTMRGLVVRTAVVGHCSIHLLDSRATTGWGCATPRHAAAHVWHVAAASRSLVHFHHDRVDDTLQLLLLRLEFVFLRQLVFVQPVKGLLHGLLNLLLVTLLELLLELLLIQRVAHREAVILQSVFCLSANW